MPLTAITCQVSPNFAACELEFLKREPIDVALAIREHQAYEQTLRSLGVRVISLPAAPEFPDSVFVEDPAIVLDEVAIVTHPGAPSRQGEEDRLASALAEFRKLRRVVAPATLEGGDVLRVGRTLYVGNSRRTSADGIEQLRTIAEPFGYHVIPIGVHGCLHLKTACCALPDGRMLANRAWIDTISLPEVIEVPEPWGANVLCVGDTVLAAASAPETCALLERSGYRLLALDITELQKAEAGLTCLSLLAIED